MRKVLKNNPAPLYYQIKQILLETIENGELKPGELVPTEKALCELHGVSKITVNKAIMELVNEGVLYREKGKGTFVAQSKEKHQLNQLKGFTEEMKEKGLDTDVKILSFHTREATKQIKLALNMKDTDNKIIEITRLRISDNSPVAIETAWIPYNLFPDMTREMIEGQSLYSIFREKYGYYPKRAKQTVEPIMLNDYESMLLGRPSSYLALMFQRNTYIEDGTPIEYTKAIYRSDKYKYEVILE